MKFELQWDKGVDDSKALQFNAKVSPQQVLVNFKVPSKAGSIEVERLESGFTTTVHYDQHFLDSRLKWRQSGGVYGIKGSLNSSISHLKNLKGVAKCSIKDIEEGRKLAGQVSVLINRNWHWANIVLIFGPLKAI